MPFIYYNYILADAWCCLGHVDTAKEMDKPWKANQLISQSEEPFISTWKLWIHDIGQFDPIYV